jgi:CxxC motif-containing protein
VKEREARGVSREEKIRCIGCPLGCLVTLTVDDKGEVVGIAGYQCKDGQKYVLDEYRNPMRVLTATVLTQGSSRPLLAVRTTRPILKTRLAEGMTVLAKARAKPPIKIGDVVIPNLLGTGADVVATTDLPS